MQEFANQYAKPDWSLAELQIGTRDLGWAEGYLSDKRPFFIERWQEGDNQLATFYFSSERIQDKSVDELVILLLDSQLFTLQKEPIPVDSAEVKDSIGQLLFSLNLVLSDAKECYAQLEVPINDYGT